MKTKLIISIGCFLLMAGLAFGRNILPISDGNSRGDNIQPAPVPPTPDAGEMLSLTSGGLNSITLNSGTTSFELDASSSWTGYSSTGLSYWLQVPSAVASAFSITGVTYGSTFPDGNQTSPATVLFNDSTAADGAKSGYTIEIRDLGSTESAGAIAAGTYSDTSMTLNLTGLAPGTYVLASTTSGSRPSEQSDIDFGTHSFPEADFTITVVPEPATLSLLGLGGLGSFGLTMLRARRKS